MKKALVTLLAIFTLQTQADTAPDALLFNVTGSPSQITVNTVTANYYPAAGIKITTPGVNLTSGCTPISNTYCLFGVSNTQAASFTTDAGKILNFNLCLNGNGPVSCQQFSLTQQFAYITNGFPGDPNDPHVSRCSLDSLTGDILSCVNAAADAAAQTKFSASGGFNGIYLDNLRNLVYLSVSFSGLPDVYQCSVNPQGLFTDCSLTTITSPSGYQSSYGMLTVNSSNTIAYLVSEPGSLSAVLACPINANVISDTCTDTGATVSSGAVQIALNSNNSVAYIGSYSDNYVTVCNVSSDGLSFTSCVNKTGGGIINFSGPAGVALNNSQSLLYVADYTNGEVYFCSTTPNGLSTTFDNCSLATTGLASLNGIALNENNTTAYIAQFGDTYVCPINPDGTFDTCSASALAPNATAVALSN
jgi:hypothetical protein